MTRLERKALSDPRFKTLAKYNKNLKHLFEKGVYSYQECIEHRGSMFKCLNRKKKK